MPITDYYVTTDAMGSVMAVLDESGNVLERRSYDAFGEATYMLADGTVVPDSPTGVDIGFQGQLMDELTGMYQMGFRWYLPALGRWVSRDPIGLKGGANPMAFVSNCPGIHSDAVGLKIELKCTPPAALRAFEEKYRTARNYLEHSKTFADLFRRADALKQTITIQCLECTQGPRAYSVPTYPSTVFWNPNLGGFPTRTPDCTPAEGAGVSPALTLAHELAHAVLIVENPTLHANLRSQARGNYMDNAEEDRVITQVENVGAKELNAFNDARASPREWIRRVHLYSKVLVESPTDVPYMSYDSNGNPRGGYRR